LSLIRTIANTGETVNEATCFSKYFCETNSQCSKRLVGEWLTIIPLEALETLKIFFATMDKIGGDLDKAGEAAEQLYSIYEDIIVLTKIACEWEMGINIDADDEDNLEKLAEYFFRFARLVEITWNIRNNIELIECFQKDVNKHRGRLSIYG